MAWCIVKEKQALGPFFCEALKDINGTFNLIEQVIG